MAKQTRTQLRERANTLSARNSLGSIAPTDVFGLIMDLIDSIPTDYDNGSYEIGQQAIWKGRILQAFQAVGANQSPLTHANKWNDQVIDSVDKLGDGGANLPIMVSAFKPYVAAAIDEAVTPDPASLNAPGTVQFGDPANPADATSTTKVYSIKDVNDLIGSVLKLISSSSSGFAFNKLTKTYNNTPGTANYQRLTLTVITDGTTPQLKVVGMGAVVEWKTGTVVVGQTNTFTVWFDGVVTSGFLFIRALGSLADGICVVLDVYPLDFSPFIPATGV